MRHVLALLAAGLALASPAAASTQAEADIWSDPAFRARFLGSYAALGEHEPRLSVEERQSLEKVIPLLSSDLPAAATQLQALATPQGSALLDFTLGNVCFQLDRLDEAIAAYTAAVTKFPDFERAWRNLALASVRGSRMPEAIRAFTRLIELGGGDGISYGMLGNAYVSREDYLAAESAYRQASLLQPESLDWKLGMARCLLKQQKHGEAVALLGRLIEEHPDRTDFWLLQANAWIGMKEPLEAARNFEILSRMGRATPEILNMLGDIYVNESLLEPASRAYASAIAATGKPDYERAVRGAEVLAARGGEPASRRVIAALREAAGGGLEEALQRRLLKVEARFAVQDGGGDGAAAVLEQIVTLDPLDGEALMLLGDLRARAGELEPAMLAYERAESLKDFEADAKLRRARILVQQSRFADALPLLKRSQELKPRDDLARYVAGFGTWSPRIAPRPVAVVSQGQSLHHS
jgi:tetratricopeptide (TPR) repeat protein